MSSDDSNEETTTATPTDARVNQYPHNIRDALLMRGWGEGDTISADKAFDEFCDWHGLIGWGPTLAAVLGEARETVRASS